MNDEDNDQATEKEVTEPSNTNGEATEGEKAVADSPTNISDDGTVVDVDEGEKSKREKINGLDNPTNGDTEKQYGEEENSGYKPDDNEGRTKENHQPEAKKPEQDGEEKYQPKEALDDSEGSTEDGFGDEAFDDPTDSLLSYGHELPELTQEEVEQYSQRLQANRLIILSCLDEEVATSTAYSLVEQNTFSDLEKRALQIDDFRNRERDDLSIELLMEPYAFGNKTQGKDTIIVTMPSDRDEFYGSLTSGTLSAKRIEERLSDFKRFIICIVNSRLRERLISQTHQETSFELIDIDYLPPLLRHHIDDKRKAGELVDVLRQQQRDGLWDEDETDFYEHIKELIRDNKLIKEITRIKQSPEQGYTQYLEEEIEKIKTAFKEEKTIECAVLYVATFFEQLNTTDFSKVVECLLAGKTRVHQEKKITKKGKVKYIQGEDESLVAVWKAQKDKILNDCYIMVITLKDSTKRVLDFSFPYLRRIVKRYLEGEKAYYLDGQFERLKKDGLLFDDSLKIRECVANLATDMAASNPEVYEENWLFEWIAALGNIEQESPGGVREEILRDVIQPMTNEKKQRVFSRMAYLIRNMMQHSSLHQTVREFLRRFLNGLINLGVHLEVLEIVRRMRFIPDFDQLHWIEQLLKREDEKTHGKTSQFLYNYIKYSASHFNEVIKQLYENPLSSVHMFPVFIDFLVKSTVTFKKSQDADPTNHTLLAALIEENGDRQTFAKLLFHPDSLTRFLRRLERKPLMNLILAKGILTLRSGNYTLAKAEQEQLFFSLASSLAPSLDRNLRQRQISNRPELQQLLADASNQSITLIKRWVADIISVLIAEWFVIIHGLEDSQQNEEGIKIFDQFLEQIIDAVPERKKERTKELMACWKKMAGLIRNVINNIKQEQNSQRDKNRAKLIKSLALKEKQIKKLRIKLKTLSKAS